MTEGQDIIPVWNYELWGCLFKTGSFLLYEIY